MTTDVSISERIAQIVADADRVAAQHGTRGLSKCHIYEAVRDVFDAEGYGVPHSLGEAVCDALAKKRIGANYLAKVVIAEYLSRKETREHRWLYVIGSTVGLTDDVGKVKPVKLPKLGSVGETQYLKHLFAMRSVDPWAERMQKIYSDGEYAWATDGFRLAKAPTILEEGLYVPNGKAEPLRMELGDDVHFWETLVPQTLDRFCGDKPQGYVYTVDATDVAQLLGEVRFALAAYKFVRSVDSFDGVGEDFDYPSRKNLVQIEGSFFNAEYLEDTLALMLDLMTGSQGYTQLFIDVREDSLSPIAVYRADGSAVGLVMPIKGQDHELPYPINLKYRLSGMDASNWQSV